MKVRTNPDLSQAVVAYRLEDDSVICRACLLEYSAVEREMMNYAPLKAEAVRDRVCDICYCDLMIH